jgi:hypothetical protein
MSDDDEKKYQRGVTYGAVWVRPTRLDGRGMVSRRLRKGGHHSMRSKRAQEDVGTFYIRRHCDFHKSWLVNDTYASRVLVVCDGRTADVERQYNNNSISCSVPLWYLYDTYGK